VTRAAAPLDADTILTVTEEVLRRYGPAKATVLDVARMLGVSHTAVYRYFPSKAALREAVTRRWLSRDRDALAAIAADTGLAPPQRLRAWLTAVFAAKQAKAHDDPELYAAYAILAAEHSSAAADHVADLLRQLQAILADGTADGTFVGTDPAAAAQTVFDATTRFHHPAHAPEWQAPGIESDLDAVCTLLLAGLTGSGLPLPLSGTANSAAECRSAALPCVPWRAGAGSTRSPGCVPTARRGGCCAPRTRLLYSVSCTGFSSRTTSVPSPRPSWRAAWTTSCSH
jgi:AcrR family transcriptional regulator